MDTRILLTIVLALGLVFAYQELVIKRLYPPPAQNAAQPIGSCGRGTSIWLRCDRITIRLILIRIESGALERQASAKEAVLF